MGEQTRHVPPPLACRTAVFEFHNRSYIMGILNVTPDSFSDGGRYCTTEQAVAHGMDLAQQGADIIDIGGESTRPGAGAVSAEEETARVLPVIEELASRIRVPLSIDTTKAEVARRALDAGAEIVNDISAMRMDPEMAPVVAAYEVPVILMHMLGTPATMQKKTHYNDLLHDIRDFLEQRIDAACNAGIAPDRIIIDPGIGFGKSVHRDNFILLNKLATFTCLGRPVLIGPSRKRFLGTLLGKEVTRREEGTAAAVAIAVYNGASFVRVHDVEAMKLVVKTADAIKRAETCEDMP